MVSPELTGSAEAAEARSTVRVGWAQDALLEEADLRLEPDADAEL